MASALVTPVSGPVIGTWNALALGTTNDDGYSLSCTIQGQEVNASDAYGQTLVEGIYRGQNWRCQIEGLEWNRAGLLDSLNAFGRTGASGTFTPQLTAVGDKYSTYAKVLLLDSILGSPPTTPDTLTASNAIIAPQSRTAFDMTSKMRVMPIEYVFLPYQATVGSATVNVFFTVT